MKKLALFVLLSMILSCSGASASAELPLTGPEGGGSIVTISADGKSAFIPDSKGSQQILIDLSYYWGVWQVGDIAGSSYIYDDIDPHQTLTGGILILEEDKVIFQGSQNSITLESPQYFTFLELPQEFASKWRASFGGFQFPNAYVVRLEIYDSKNEAWMPEGLGPIWIKDINTLIAHHHAFHELNRIEAR